MKLEIDLADTATPRLAALAARITPGGAVWRVLGRTLAESLRAHFRQRAAQPNKLGGARTFFWSRVAQGVQNPALDATGVSVAISHPHIRQKYLGGRITPGPGKTYLTIPVNAAAHGRAAGTFQNLAFIPARAQGPTGGYLVEGEAYTRTRGKNKGQAGTRPKPAGRMLYVLRRYVDQEADPATLPPESALRDDLLAAARLALGEQS